MNKRARAVRVLLDLAGKSDRPHAISLLGAMASANALGGRYNEALAGLSAVLQSHPDRLTRHWAADSLGNFGRPATAVLTQAKINDSDLSVRERAAQALESIERQEEAVAHKRITKIK